MCVCMRETVCVNLTEFYWSHALEIMSDPTQRVHFVLGTVCKFPVFCWSPP